MIIIAGYGIVDPERREAHVDGFRNLVARARETDGCVHFAITADSVDPDRVNIVEIWRDDDALNAWRKRARAPRATRPTRLEVTRYDATDTGLSF